MEDVFRAVKNLLETGGRGALATVVRARGSTPRRAGAKMLILDSGEIVGTIGGGCIEASVRREAEKVLSQGVPGLFSFDLTADAAAESGMVCGGMMDVFIEPIGGSAGLDEPKGAVG